MFPICATREAATTIRDIDEGLRACSAQRSGSFFGIDLGDVTDTINAQVAKKTTDYGGEGVGQAEDFHALFVVASYASLAVTAVYFLLIVTQIDKISLCIRIIENSSSFIAKLLPGIVTFPCCVYLMQLVFFLMAVFMCE